MYESVICDCVSELSAENRVVVIGIDGLGGAGKSTISERICGVLRDSGLHTVLLHIDDFINVRAVRYDPAYPEWQCYYDLQWRYEYFAQIIDSIKHRTNERIEVELYDKDNDCYFLQSYEIKEKTVVIVEGIFLQRKELHGLFDRMIYIDIPEDVRMSRVLKRDTYIGNERQIIDKYENRYFPAERRYAAEYRPERSADHVIGE